MDVTDDGKPLKCSYCDVTLQQEIAARLLHTLATLSACRKLPTGTALDKLRHELLGDPKPPKKGMATLNERLDKLDKLNAGLDVKDKLFTSMEDLERRVAVKEKELELGADFRQGRREQLAAELIARYDTKCEHHCGAEFLPFVPAEAAGSSEVAREDPNERHRLGCIFRPMACQHEGCTAMFSARAEPQHDAVCGFKLLACPQGCGAHLTRATMDEHCAGPCPSRPIPCTFKHIGCHEHVTVGTLEAHLASHSAHHLLLAVNLIEAGRQVQQAQAGTLTSWAAQLNGFHTEIAALRAENAAMKEAARELEEATLAALKAGAKESSTALKALNEGLAKLGKQQAVMGRDLGAEVGKLNTSHAKLARSVDEVARAIGPPGAPPGGAR